MSKDKLKAKFVLEMIEDIESYIKKIGKISTLLEDKMAFNATLMNLLQIGETLNKIDETILKKYNLFQDTKGAYGVRNFIAHDYDGIRKSIIEDILRYKLSDLKSKIEFLISKI